ncbi:DUF411 domain-containing protein [Azospirillum picis]|uniref:DUF411 domain-containing protein n=1 Tax=Azospirillum picis TaxID=488438 RepID=A0ABU0MMK3_9PROT|nr:DUF411 domain-containing protein [Azospirillum picis]MBP2300726.1 hypothetical protein [Azospirillum picis]MDQ0534695.1 hypothetical protein [Azospirillum picis]
MPVKSRKLILSAAAGALLAGGAWLGALAVASSPAAAGTVVEVWKAVTCECCAGWVKHMTAAGFTVKVHEVEDVGPVKAANGVPDQLQSCHTALVDGYAVEGHVPAADVKRLLAERPAAKGLSVPGMPQDAPGMDMKTGEPYQTVLFGAPDGKPRVFATH